MGRESIGQVEPVIGRLHNHGNVIHTGLQEFNINVGNLSVSVDQATKF